MVMKAYNRQIHIGHAIKAELQRQELLRIMILPQGNINHVVITITRKMQIILIIGFC